MAETESVVQILLKVLADKAQLTALQADFLALKETGTASMVGIGSSADDLLAHLQQIEQAAGLPNFKQGFSNAAQSATAATQATEGASLSAANWSERMIAAAEAGAAWNAQSTTAVATQLGLGGATAKTAANFAPATAAMRAFSKATDEQRAALAALIATDNAAGFESLVQGILAGTAATKGFNAETGLLKAVAKEAELNTTSLARGVDQMTAGALRLVPGMGAASGAVRGLGGGAITTASQIGLLNAVMVGAGIAGVLAFTAAMAALVTKGIEVQKTLDDVGAGVQGTLKGNTDFNAFQISSAGPASIMAVTKAADDAKVPITDLAKAFDAVFPAASRANTTIAGLANVMARLISQEDTLHIPQQKIVTDLEQIFNGSVKNTNQLAQQLGITKEQAAAWREAGTTTDELTTKTTEFAAANDTGTQSIARSEQVVSHAFENLATAAAKPLIEPLTKALNDCAAAMNNPGFQAGATIIVGAIAQIVAGAEHAIQILNGFDDAIYGAIKAMGAWIVEHGKMGQAGEFVDENGPGLYRGPNQNQIAAGLNTGRSSTGLQAGGDENDIDEVMLRKREVTGTPTGTRPAVGAGGGGGGGGGGKGPSQDTQDQQEISDIMSQINEKQAAYNTLIEKAKVEHELGKTSLSEEQAIIVSNGDKQSKSIDESIAKLTAMKSKIEEIGAAQGGLTPKEDTQVNKIQASVDKLELMRLKLEQIKAQNTFGGQMTIGLQKFIDSLTLTGAKLQDFFNNSVNTGIDATASALTGLISGTKNWADAFKQAAESIIQNLIKIGLQALVGMALQQTVGAATRLEDARTAAAGAYQSAAQIPYIGWLIAPIAAAVAFAAVEAFAGGGIVPGASSNHDNRMAMVASGEGIVTTRAVQQYGAETIHAMNAGTFLLGGIVPRFADGGIVGGFGTQGGGGSGTKGISVNNFFDKNDLLQHMISHPDLTHHIVDTMRKNRFALKV